jgi:hypothetical protein
MVVITVRIRILTILRQFMTTAVAMHGKDSDFGCFCTRDVSVCLLFLDGG